MERRLEELERKVEALAKAIEQLSARLDARDVPAPRPEGERRAEAAPQELAGPKPEEAGVPEVGELLTRTVALVGRTSLVFAGAFLIRAITDRDLVPHGVGVSMGLAFAGLWVALGWRAAVRRNVLSASFHAGSAALIGFPLVGETATRLELVPAPVAAGLLAGFSGYMLLAAWHARHQLTAWLGVTGGVVTASLLLARTDAPSSLSLALLFLAAATLVLADVRGWGGLRWPVALLLDFVAARRVFSASAVPEKAAQVGEATALAMIVVLLYLGALAWTTWRRARNVGPFEVVQAALVVAMGVSVAARVEPAYGAVTLATGCLGLLLFGACVVTAAKTSDRPEHGIDVWFYGLLGLAWVISGGLLLTRGPLVTLLWSALALASAVLGRRTRTLMMWVFATMLAFASVIAGDVTGMVSSAFFAAPEVALRFDLQASVMVAVLVVLWLLTSWRIPGVHGHGGEPPAAQVAGGQASTAGAGVPRGASTGPRVVAALLLILSVLGLASLAVLAIRALFPITDASVIILVRTLVLVGGGLGLALARRVGPRELGWVAWVALGLAGVKILAQDLPSSRASTLFISFLVFGGATIALPYAMRTRTAKTKPAGSG